MGTPEFSAVSLNELISNGYDIRAVFTQPDKPVGRKQILTFPPVKEIALDNNIEVYQPKTLKSQDILNIIRGISPDVIVVVAYGKILPKNILDVPKIGCVNVHGSLLPKYRGAAPIQWSIINGEQETGITTMFMDEGLDTGDILLKEITCINDNETSGDLYERLSKIGAKLLIKTLKGLEKGEIIRMKQGKGESYAPPLNKSLAEINFNKTATEVHNLIRGLNPWPIAYTVIDGKNLKVYDSRIALNSINAPGEVINISPFIIGCGGGTSIEFTEVQLEGKKRMSSKEFLKGFKINKGKILGGNEI